ncbi:putative bifunctional ribonuclease H/phosphoglycerate mutase [Actinoplanes missouriensis 431]|uniref:Putative bifunctional ribonuclease H/phosphoglycerate mutase n=1 Tax=Actinoplanes missouriensis (strain ATCC 14538 / DSM 43046 / CBS 188.64 / JCM 3121 / NBRC 102363 / NCIMB 12654 / NRRL B-3342 / UNCC 431) TaxID=512565 RepID=I0H0L2_ACTM4|nr:putative bifunctional ribonuclease H/phosphoglycerate mutase [Actinoplanes missouriensis 431]
MSLHVIVEADGGSRGNPGPAGFGAVVKEAATGEILLERYDSAGVTTNNVAEYSGLIAGLRAAAELNATRVDVRMDSKLVIEQMSGRWQIKNAGLRPLAAEAATLVGKFDEVTFDWIPRERNKDADALANRAMDEAAGKAPRAGQQLPSERAAETPKSWVPPALENATRIALVRHGATPMTAQGRYSGRGDVPLTDEGEAQAMAAAGRVAGIFPEVAAVLSSPLSRCVRTAEHIAAQVGGVPVTVMEDLIECDFGAWEGRTFAEVQEQWPAEMSAWLGSTSVAPPGGESFQAVAKRVRGAMATVLSAYPGKAVVVVSHVSPIKLILRDALAAGDAFLHRLYLDAAGVSTMDVWPDGNIAVRTVNETAHLR